MATVYGPSDPTSDAVVSQENLAPPIIAGAVVATVVAAVAVGARFYTRAKILRTVGIEDWSILVALAFSVGRSAVITVAAMNALGHHVWTVPFDKVVVYLKAHYASLFCYHLGLSFTKISILLLYLRVLPYTRARYAVYVLLAAVAAYMVWTVYGTATLCTPLEMAWNPLVVGTCRGADYMWAVATLHVATDFATLSVPLPVVLRMRMPLQQKTGLVAVLVMGFFICIVAVFRALYAGSVLASKSLRASDFTWNVVPATNWSTVELNLAIVLPCLIVIRPLASRLWTYARSSVGSSGTNAHERGLRGRHGRRRRCNGDDDPTAAVAAAAHHTNGAGPRTKGGRWHSYSHPPTIGSTPVRNPSTQFDEAEDSGLDMEETIRPPPRVLSEPGVAASHQSSPG